MEDKWVKVSGLWRRKDDDRWGTGDVIFNTCSKIIQDNDTSDWAYAAVGQCIDLLLADKRWPDSLNTGYEAPNMIAWRFKKYKYRPQTRMSRDPFIAVIACLVLFDNTWVIKYLDIPPWLYRHSVWTWRKRLIKDDSKFYIKRLRYLRALATVKHFERTNKLWKA